ncbi:MAG TPA: MBL fold metallo-hydrolase [Dehalococcoidia bacterium]|nr:MBL fold metallo-hydrolase [Dehalococcoidia bacterium]
MKIKWLGHASFLITLDNGTRIITDPYIVGSGLRYGEIKEAADVVTVSHDHFDHNNVASVGGNPQVVKGPGEAKGIKFEGVPTYHDTSGGSERGNNTIFCMDIDGVRVCHLGDLGHPLSDQQVADIGKVDVLLIPVGGFFTIDAKVASEVCDKLNPRVIVPMHYKNEKCEFPISGVDDFLEGKGSVRKLDSSEAEFKAGELPAETEIIVLKPML